MIKITIYNFRIKKVKGKKNIKILKKKSKIHSQKVKGKNS